jgi:hypothetical protein
MRPLSRPERQAALPCQALDEAASYLATPYEPQGMSGKSRLLDKDPDGGGSSTGLDSSKN